MGTAPTNWTKYRCRRFCSLRQPDLVVGVQGSDPHLEERVSLYRPWLPRCWRLTACPRYRLLPKEHAQIVTTSADALDLTRMTLVAQDWGCLIASPRWSSVLLHLGIWF